MNIIKDELIWEHLKNGTINGLIDFVPSDIVVSVKERALSMEMQFADIEWRALKVVEKARDFTGRESGFEYYREVKEQLGNEYIKITHQMMSGEDYAQTIWDMIKPSNKEKIL